MTWLQNITNLNHYNLSFLNVKTIVSLLMHICQIDYSRKKTKQGGFRTYFFENVQGVFNFFTLPLEIPDKTKFHPWKLHKIVFNTLEITRPLKDPHYFFLVILGNWSPLSHLLVTPENSTSSSPPPPFVFFWNSSINTTKVVQSHPIDMGQL